MTVKQFETIMLKLIARGYGDWEICIRNISRDGREFIHEISDLSRIENFYDSPGKITIDTDDY